MKARTARQVQPRQQPPPPRPRHACVRACACVCTGQVNRGFTFVAECYWDREWELQTLGFDFCYDKCAEKNITKYF